MKQMVVIGTLAFALTTAGAAAAQQGTAGTQDTQQQQQGAADQRNTSGAVGTSGMQGQTGQDQNQQDRFGTNQQDQYALPATASPLALVLLGGLTALGAGFAVRRARR